MFKILMVQESPCIRNVKTALMLKEKGHQVDGAVTVSKAADRLNLKQHKPYYNEYKIDSYPDLVELGKEYDIVHVHNGPDRLGALAFATGKPVVWDCHDLVSSLEIEDPRGNDLILEVSLYKGADGVVFASPGFADYCATTYGSTKAQPLVSYNLPSRYMLYGKKKKLGEDYIHIVYAGSLSDKPGNHRNFLDEFKELLSLFPNVKLHIYPAVSPVTKKDGIGTKMEKHSLQSYADLEKDFGGRVAFYDPVSPFDLISELSQYDYGWMPFKSQGKFTELFIPNKLYEYTAAGLAIITRKFKTVDLETQGWNNIILYRSLQEIKELQKPEAPTLGFKYFECQYKDYLGLYKRITSRS